MEQYTLIELDRCDKAKNSICQLLDRKIVISLENVEETRSYIVAIDKGVRYCITGNPEIVDPASEYVILCDHAPSKRNY